MNDTVTTTEEPKPARPMGRPALPESERAKTRAFRLTDAEAEKLDALGGVTWLRRRIKAAKLPKD